MLYEMSKMSICSCNEATNANIALGHKFIKELLLLKSYRFKYFMYIR